MRTLVPTALLLSLMALAPGALLARNGMSWVKLSHESTYSTDNVGCPDCNPYTGETPCSSVLPVLCLRVDGSPNPGLSISSYNGWASGHILLTPPVSGLLLESFADASNICASYFGPGYVMGEFHDGAGGWNWNAYGNIRSGTRFWVAIDDQPANCWD